MAADKRRPGRAILGIWLAAVAGFVDAVGYIELHREFVAHMTGNTNQLGQQLAKGLLGAAVPLVVAVASFVGSIALVTAIRDRADEAGLRSPTAAALAVETVPIAVFMAYGSAVTRHGTIPGRGLGFYVCAIAAVGAMGAQTAAVTKWGERTIRTTYISGMLTRLGQELSRLPRRRGRGASARGKDPRPVAAAVYLALFCGFLGGGVLGTWALRQIELWSLAIPLGAVAAGAIADWRRPTN